MFKFWGTHSILEAAGIGGWRTDLAQQGLDPLQPGCSDSFESGVNGVKVKLEGKRNQEPCGGPRRGF